MESMANVFSCCLNIVDHINGYQTANPVKNRLNVFSKVITDYWQ